MGVSLERVQNKFACIIGELCNEPLVLSQFAVWLDMRLAEYKAKGSLCLECSGDIPTPVWLKGLPLKEPIVEATDQWNSPRDTGQGYRGRGDNLHTPSQYNRRHRSYLPDSGTTTPISHPSSPSRTDLDLHSNISIKQEVLDHQDVVPVGIHSSDSYHRDSRKRTAEPLSEFDSLYSSPSKAQRFSEKDNAEVSPYTEPLSSIIDPQDTPISKADGQMESTATSSQQAYENVVDDDDDIQVEILGGPSSLLHSPSSSINQPFPGPSTSETGHSFAANSADSESSRLSFGDSMASVDPANLTVGRSRSANVLGTEGASAVMLRGLGPFPESKGHRSDYLETRLGQPIHRQTAKMTTTSLNVFRRWMVQELQSDVPIEKITPAELDPILAKFYSTVRTRTGKDYSAMSLKACREGLERHLKGCGYPASITTCPVFRASQQAYKLQFWKLQLQTCQRGVDP